MEKDDETLAQKKPDPLALASYSIEEPFVGNVTECIPLPPDYKGRPKKGCLRFEARFEGGEEIWLPIATRVSTLLLNIILRKPWASGLH